MGDPIPVRREREPSVKVDQSKVLHLARCQVEPRQSVIPCTSAECAEELFAVNGELELVDRVGARREQCLRERNVLSAGAAQEADKLTNSTEADRLRSLRGRELFIELSNRGWSLSALQWAKIVTVDVDGDRASMAVERPSVAVPPRTGNVFMVRENGEWKLDAAEATRK